MKKFQVYIEYTVMIPDTADQTVIVEAENAEEAEDAAILKLFGDTSLGDDVEIEKVEVDELSEEDS
jgi:hypothetical protein